jgi:acyl-CoA synthetase (NDP forming)
MAAFSLAHETAVAVAAPQKSVRDEFTKAGVPTFASERVAMDALAQLADHAKRLEQPAMAAAPKRPFWLPIGSHRFLHEAESLEVLARAGLPVVEHRLCRTEDEVRGALGPPLVMKACSRDVPHKTEHGLVSIAPSPSSGANARRSPRSGRASRA